jgi:hypothetical protein
MTTYICTEDVDCTDNAQQIFWWENEEWTGVVGFLFLFFSHTGDVVSAMM